MYLPQCRAIFLNEDDDDDFLSVQLYFHIFTGVFYQRNTIPLCKELCWTLADPALVHTTSMRCLQKNKCPSELLGTSKVFLCVAVVY